MDMEETIREGGGGGGTKVQWKQKKERIQRD